MKCRKCFFACYMGKGTLADVPLIYCKFHKTYQKPFVCEYENGKPKIRQLDFSKREDIKIWYEVGCNIHPNTVKKAKNKFLKSLEEGGDGNETR